MHVIHTWIMLSYMAETLQKTQTLSLRISEVLRKRLEDIRKLTALWKGESVSTSASDVRPVACMTYIRYSVVHGGNFAADPDSFPPHHRTSCGGSPMALSLGFSAVAISCLLAHQG